MTNDEYQAIGRRVAACKYDSPLVVRDRAALWAALNALTEKYIRESEDSAAIYWVDGKAFPAQFGMEAAKAALLESLGGEQ